MLPGLRQGFQLVPVKLEDRGFDLALVLKYRSHVLLESCFLLLDAVMNYPESILRSIMNVEKDD